MQLVLPGPRGVDELWPAALNDPSRPPGIRPGATWERYGDEGDPTMLSAHKRGIGHGMTPGERRRRKDGWRPELEGREDFLRENAVSLIRERDRRITNMSRELRRLNRQVATLRADLAAARQEIATDDELLAERDRILDAEPCQAHGRCVPHVLNLLADYRGQQQETALAGTLIYGPVIDEAIALHGRRWGDRELARITEQTVEEAAEVIVALQHTKRASRQPTAREEALGEIADLVLNLEVLLRLWGVSRDGLMALVGARAERVAVLMRASLDGHAGLDQ